MQINTDYRRVFYHIPNIGGKGDELFDAMTDIIIIIERLKRVIATAATIRLVLDDSPTKRYGCKIEGNRRDQNSERRVFLIFAL